MISPKFEKLVLVFLDWLADEEEEFLKAWITSKWPHGIGLFK